MSTDIPSEVLLKDPSGCWKNGGGQVAVKTHLGSTLMRSYRGLVQGENGKGEGTRFHKYFEGSSTETGQCGMRNKEELRAAPLSFA